jgi:uncharacterized protein
MSRANIAMVQDIYAAIACRNFEAATALMTTEVEWRINGRSDVCSTIGSWKTPEEVLNFFRLVADTQDFSNFTPGSFYARWDKIFVLGHHSFTAKKTGRRVEIDCVHVFTINGGKVSSFCEYTDTAAIIDAFRN